MALLILASRSPRRQALLRAAAVAFEVRVASVDEREHNHGAPRAVALKTAWAKAADIARDADDGDLVLAADTIVVLDDRILTQPAGRDEAADMLRRLSGRAHTVLTGLALMRVGGPALSDVVRARVRFHTLDPTLIADYVASGEADDKAGAYGIQGLGARFVAEVEGDLTAVVGLPMRRVWEMARELGGGDLFPADADLRAVAHAAFPDLARLPEACLTGIAPSR